MFSGCTQAEAPPCQQSWHSIVLTAAQQQEIGKDVELPAPLEVEPGGTIFSHARVVARYYNCARICVFRWAQARTFDVNWGGAARAGHGFLKEAATMHMLDLLSALWHKAGIKLDKQPVRVRACIVEPFNTSATFQEHLPSARTLGELKKQFTKGDVALRVADFLGYDGEKLARLAATAAGFLASNYLLGATAGHGDNIIVDSDGSLLRRDFRYLFGRHPSIAGAPVVWLPKAVTAALGSRWPSVQEQAMRAFIVGLRAFSPAPPAPPAPSEDLAMWAAMQAALLFAEHTFGASSENYLVALSEGDFQSAMQTADSGVGKKVMTLLHDVFGLQSADGPMRSQKGTDINIQLLHQVLTHPHGIIGDAVWAVGAESWPVAASVVACLCATSVAGDRVLQNLVEERLVAAARCEYHAAAGLRADCLKAVAGLLHLDGDHVRTWLKRAAHSRHHVDCLGVLALWVQDIAVDARTCSLGHTDEFSQGSGTSVEAGATFQAGAMCAVARMERSLPPINRGLPDSEGALASTELHARCLARRATLRAVAHAVWDNNGKARRLAPELASYLPVGDLVAATQDLDTGERPGVVHNAESLARDSLACEVSAQWARDFLTAMAQDTNPEVSRAALCSIACAVHDDNPMVREWSRSFLTSDALEQDRTGASSPVSALVRLSRANSITSVGSRDGA